jgi:hypothetical protein
MSISHLHAAISGTDTPQIPVNPNDKPLLQPGSLPAWLPPKLARPDADELSPLTTMNIMRTIDIISLMLNSIAREAPEFFKNLTVPSDHATELAYSLNVVAALTCRLAGHKICTMPQLSSIHRDYRLILINRFRRLVKHGKEDMELERKLVDADLFCDRRAEPWDELFPMTASRHHNCPGNGDEHAGETMR